MFTTEVKPSDVHKALESLGLKPGKLYTTIREPYTRPTEQIAFVSAERLAWRKAFSVLPFAARVAALGKQGAVTGLLKTLGARVAIVAECTRCIHGRRDAALGFDDADRSRLDEAEWTRLAADLGLAQRVRFLGRQPDI